MNLVRTVALGADNLRVILVLAVFGLALTFDSYVFSATPLLLAAGLLLVGLGRRLASPDQSAIAQYPLQAAFTAAVVLLLAALYQASLSQDVSYVPSWMLGCSLAAYWLLLGCNQATRMLLWWLLVATTAAIACYSSWHFVIDGVRASKPINDPNNYASQLYLLWIPSLHLLLTNHWAGRTTGVLASLVAIAGTALVAFTMFATESRAGMIILLVALAFWWWLALTRHYELRTLLLHSAVLVAVLAGCTLMMGTSGVAPGGGNTLSGGMAVRFGLMAEAWQLYLERPFAGVGLGVFAALYAARRPLWDQVTAGRFVHNDYLQFLLEGGPLLLLALLGVAIWSVFLLRRALAAPVDQASFGYGGFALAACALLGHAFINFVFYLFTLPLLLAVVLAFAQPPLRADSTAGAAKSATDDNNARVLSGFATRLAGLAGMVTALPRRWLWIPLVLGWCAWGYLAVDIVTNGVIAGARGVPFVDSLRATPASVQRYARLAQQLNDDRGLPFLADAAITAQQAAANGDEDGFTYSLRTFRHAIEVDPWNTSAYVAMYDMFRAQPALLRYAEPDEYPDALLQRALSLNRQFLPALDALLALFENDPPRHRYVLVNYVAPWLELIARENVPKAQRYHAQLQGLIAPGEYQRLQTLLAALAEKRRRGQQLK